MGVELFEPGKQRLRDVIGFPLVDADIAVGANINADKIGTGVVDNTEFDRLNGITSAIEEQGNKGAVSGYAGLGASQELLLTNFPAGTGLQVLRRNAGNTALEFATHAGEFFGPWTATHDAGDQDLDNLKILTLGNQGAGADVTLQSNSALKKIAIGAELFELQGIDALTTVRLVRNSVTPADNTKIVEILFREDDDLGVVRSYAGIQVFSEDVTNTTLDGKMVFQVNENNVFTDYIILNEDGNADIDIFRDLDMAADILMGGNDILNGGDINTDTLTIDNLAAGSNPQLSSSSANRNLSILHDATIFTRPTSGISEVSIFADYTPVAGNVFSEVTFSAETFTGAFASFARIEIVMRDNDNVNKEASLLLRTTENNALITYLEINGLNADIDVFKPLDLNNNSLNNAVLGTALAGNNQNITNLALITLDQASGTTDIIRGKVTADADQRIIIRADGLIAWGNGTNPVDVTLSRNAANVLQLGSGDDFEILAGDLRMTAGDILLGVNKITTTNALIKEQDTQRLVIKDDTDTTLFGLRVGRLETDTIRDTGGTLKITIGASVIMNTILDLASNNLNNAVLGTSLDANANRFIKSLSIHFDTTNTDIDSTIMGSRSGNLSIGSAADGAIMRQIRFRTPTVVTAGAGSPIDRIRILGGTSPVDIDIVNANLDLNSNNLNNAVLGTLLDVNTQILQFVDANQTITNSGGNLLYDVTAGQVHLWRVNNVTEMQLSATALAMQGNAILQVAFLTSNATNPADAGTIRLGNAQTINWNNAGNTANFGITGDANDNIAFDTNLDLSTKNILTDTTTGTKIGTAAAQKIGKWGVTPVIQPAHIIDADGTLADITTKFNTLLAQHATTGDQAA